MDVIKILLVDDEILFRKGIYFLLQREENIEIIHEASDGEELLTFLNSSNELPDIILMDLKMPLLNGVEATKIIRNEFPNIKIIALTSYNTDTFIANMINVGASSYLIKNATPTEMIATINEVAKNGFYYNDAIIKIINSGRSSSNSKFKSQFDNDFMTSREKEVLSLICQQKSTNEIGEILFLSPRTVEGHRNNLLLKTESKNIAGLVVYAIQNKLVELDKI
ncbi:response regulator transcription factor [Flavobacterium sp. SUN052]|nr:response regulator transcription factor [Flavobacterium sp. SUN052]MEC4004338.1 response regulator transcription factor [Flavobacterium sp. SUN052]